MSKDTRGSIQFSRRHLLKAAGIAVGALSATLPKSAKAQDVPQWGGGGGFGGGNCFLRGTLIRAAGGYRPIETLSVGDLLPTCFSKSSEIRKVASFTVYRDNAGHWPKDCRLVRVGAGAIGENIPTKDLFVTEAHALFLNDVLVPVGHLVNGKTISFVDQDVPELEYFYIEFDTHDVLDVQGALCESLRDESMEACAPVLEYKGGRSQLYSHLRSAIAPIVDLRRPLDLIRDGLEARAYL